MVDRISIEITQNQFQDLYLNPNKPCVLTEVFTRDWRSRREWVHNGKPNFEYLSDKFGKRTENVGIQATYFNRTIII